MQAIMRRAYGPPEALELRDVDKPVVGHDGVLVRVRASSLGKVVITIWPGDHVG